MSDDSTFDDDAFDEDDDSQRMFLERYEASQGAPASETAISTSESVPPESALSAWGDKETRFFYELTPEKIFSAVESFGYVCTGRCFALNSMENRVYEIEIEVEDEDAIRTPSERFRIIKFYRPGRWSREQIQAEHQFLLDLVHVEIPVIAPIVHPNGSTLYQVPECNIVCALFPKVGGRNPDELLPEQIPLVGRLLARMHTVGALKDAPERIRLCPGTYGRQSLDFLLQNKSLPPHLEQRFADVVRRICDSSEPLFDSCSYQRVHGDCHLGNLVWGPEGPFWVDFDDMVMAPCVQDLWLIVPGRDEYARKQLMELVEAYEQMRNFDRRTLRLIEPLRSLRMIHFSAWIAKRWEDPAFPRTFVEYGTERYWNEQIIQLEEQLSMISQG